MLSVVGCLLAQDSPVGNWKLSGLKVDYLHVTREDADVFLTDSYWQSFGMATPMVQVPVMDIPNGVVYQRFTNGPFTLATIDAAQLNLNVNVYPDGTGAIADGSFYPDIDLIEGTCITSPQIFPVTDTFIWEMGSNPYSADGSYTFPTSNVLGLNSINDLQGGTSWGFGLSESGTFDGWPANPTPEPLPGVLNMIADTDGNVYAASCETAVVGAACAEAGFDAATQLTECLTALTYAGIYPDGITAQVTACAMATNPAYGGSYAGSADWGGAGWLHGSHSHGMIKENVGNSQMGQDLNVDFMLEWDAIDGPTSGSGFGDIIGEDEDGDGTDYDRIFGLPALPTTTLHATCPIAPGITDYPVAGDLTGEVAALTYGVCLDGVEDNVEAQCDAAGSPVAAVTGLCVGASQGADFAAGCAAYGPGASVEAACLQLGFDAETCATAAAQGAGAVEAYCDAQVDADGDGTMTGDNSCADIGVDPCAVLTDVTFATGLCGTLAEGLTTSETCDEWAASFEDSWLDGAAAQGVLPGMSDAGMTCTQYGAVIEGACISEAGGLANNMYLIDPSIGATWNYFLTYNAASVQQGLALGYTLEQLAYSNPEYFVDDSGYDFDPSCYATGAACSGRLVMSFEPLCIQEMEARQIVAEFVNLDNLCGNTGDVNGDGATNVVDVVQIVTHVLSESGTLDAVGRCEADSNGDGVVNVVDIVLLVNSILGGSALDHGAQTDEAIIEYSNKEIKITDGSVQGIEFTISHCEDFSIELNSTFNSDYAQINKISDTETKVVVVTEGAKIDNIAEIATSCDYTIDNVVVASQHGTEMPATTKEVISKGYSVKPAYPNPFNPTTNINLTLDVAANISVQIYNISGQLVDVIAEGLYSPSSYKWTWNAENLASGVYFVKTQVGSDIHTEKIMLLK